MQVQELEPPPGNEVTNHIVPSKENIFSSNEDNNNDLPIVVRTNTYLTTFISLSHFMSYQKLSHTHKNFRTHLNSITIPKKVYEALSHIERINVITIKMEVLKKMMKELIELLKEKSLVGCK